MLSSSACPFSNFLFLFLQGKGLLTNYVSGFEYRLENISKMNAGPYRQGSRRLVHRHAVELAKIESKTVLELAQSRAIPMTASSAQERNAVISRQTNLRRG